jgi:hypothetical protein
MNPPSVVGLFCEDIREEKTDLLSLNGIMPDNAFVPGFVDGAVGTIPKLCFYSRANFDPQKPIKAISSKITLPHGEEVNLGAVGDDVIRRAIAEATRLASPIATIVQRAQFAPFPIMSLGWMKAEVMIDGVSHICAAIRFTTDEPKPSIEPERTSLEQIIVGPKKKEEK